MKHSCDGTTSPPPDRPSRLQRRPAILYLRTPTLLHLGLPLVWRRAAPIHQPEEATGRNEPSASQNRAKRNHCNQHPRASDPAMQCRREAPVPPRGLKNAASVHRLPTAPPISAHAVASASTSVASAGFPANFGAQPLLNVSRRSFGSLNSLRKHFSIIAAGRGVVGTFIELDRVSRRQFSQGLCVSNTLALLNHLDDRLSPNPHAF
jgi:hypothetical protein